MFGLSAFAQSPFAATGKYAISITENASLADASSQLSAFLESLTEAFTAGNTDSEKQYF
jgi:hypothetical protein